MPLFILFAFISLPLLEIWVLITVGSHIGALATIAATFATAVIGTILMRNQGLETLTRVRAGLDRNEMPLKPAFDGACQLVAGVLLLTPGFITDTIGLLLFVPVVRTVLMAWIISRANISVVVNTGAPADGTSRQGYDVQGYDVEGDYREVPPEPAPALADQDAGQHAGQHADQHGDERDTTKQQDTTEQKD
jgi:UPF0716 protein FxsA